MDPDGSNNNSSGDGSKESQTKKKRRTTYWPLEEQDVMDLAILTLRDTRRSWVRSAESMLDSLKTHMGWYPKILWMQNTVAHIRALYLVAPKRQFEQQNIIKRLVANEITIKSTTNPLDMADIEEAVMNQWNISFEVVTMMFHLGQMDDSPHDLRFAAILFHALFLMYVGLSRRMNFAIVNFKTHCKDVIGTSLQSMEINIGLVADHLSQDPRFYHPAVGDEGQLDRFIKDFRIQLPEDDDQGYAGKLLAIKQLASARVRFQLVEKVAAMVRREAPGLADRDEGCARSPPRVQSMAALAHVAMIDRLENLIRDWRGGAAGSGADKDRLETSRFVEQIVQRRIIPQHLARQLKHPGTSGVYGKRGRSRSLEAERDLYADYSRARAQWDKETAASGAAEPRLTREVSRLQTLVWKSHMYSVWQDAIMILLIATGKGPANSTELVLRMDPAKVMRVLLSYRELAIVCYVATYLWDPVADDLIVDVMTWQLFHDTFVRSLLPRHLRAHVDALIAIQDKAAFLRESQTFLLGQRRPRHKNMDGNGNAVADKTTSTSTTSPTTTTTTATAAMRATADNIHMRLWSAYTSFKYSGPKFRAQPMEILMPILNYWRTRKSDWWSKHLLPLKNAELDGFLSIRELTQFIQDSPRTQGRSPLKEFFVMALSLGLYPVGSDGYWTLEPPRKEEMHYLADCIAWVELNIEDHSHTLMQPASRAEMLRHARCTECQAGVMGKFVHGGSAEAALDAAAATATTTTTTTTTEPAGRWRGSPPDQAALNSVADTAVAAMDQQMEAERNVYKGKLVELKEKLERQTSQLDQTVDTIQSLREELKDVTNMLLDCKRDMAERAPQLLQEAHNQISEVEAEVGHVTSEVAEVTKEMKETTELVATATPEAALAGRNKLLDQIRGFRQQNLRSPGKDVPEQGGGDGGSSAPRTERQRRHRQQQSMQTALVHALARRRKAIEQTPRAPVPVTARRSKNSGSLSPPSSSSSSSRRRRRR